MSLPATSESQGRPRTWEKRRSRDVFGWRSRFWFPLAILGGLPDIFSSRLFRGRVYTATAKKLRHLDTILVAVVEDPLCSPSMSDDIELSSLLETLVIVW